MAAVTEKTVNDNQDIELTVDEPSAPAPADGEAGKVRKSRSKCKICCACYCCCSCAILIPLIIIIAVVASAYVGPPEIELKNAKITKMDIQSDRVVITIEPEIFIKNPNKSPLAAKVTSVTADTWSIDKQASDEVGQLLYLAKAMNPAVIDIQAESETTFKMTIEAHVVAPDSVPLSQRLTRDCAPLSDKKTKIRLVLSDIVASAMGMDLPKIDELDPIDIEIPCE